MKSAPLDRRDARHRWLPVLALFLALIPCTLLVGSAYRLMQLDADAERRAVVERRTQAADLAAAALTQRLVQDEQALRNPATTLALGRATGATAVVFTRQTAAVASAEGVPYLPVAPAGRLVPAGALEPGELLEFGHNDPAGAEAWFAARTTAADPALRAGALIARARNLRKLGRVEEALATYAQVGTDNNVLVAGVPADLLARWAACDLLAAQQRPLALQQLARALLSELTRGRWPITRVVYEQHRQDAREWAGQSGASFSDDAARSRAEAVGQLWTRWLSTGLLGNSSGREVVDAGGVRFTVLWHRTPAAFTALLADPGYAETQWTTPVAALLAPQHLLVSTRDRSDKRLAGDESSRPAGETGLPWSVIVADDGRRSDVDRLATRRSTWLVGIGALTVLVLTGTFLVTRAVSRQIETARLQSAFVASVSHEFRTPLTSLRQLSEALVDDRVPDEPRRQTYYRALARQTERLHRLVESLLDFGRIEAGRSPYRNEALDVTPLVEHTVAAFREETAARGTRIVVTVDENLPRISGDSDALTHALWNLLDNAVKYSPGRDTVWVHVGAARASVTISVRDEGIGIPREEQRAIRGRFVRGRDAASRGIPGTGLGLAMVDHIVRGHGGGMHVRSEQGTGSTFTIELPGVRA